MGQNVDCGNARAFVGRFLPVQGKEVTSKKSGDDSCGFLCPGPFVPRSNAYCCLENGLLCDSYQETIPNRVAADNAESPFKGTRTTKIGPREKEGGRNFDSLCSQCHS